MDNQDNIMYLKQKCNAQLDRIEELEKTLEAARLENVSKAKEIKELVAEIQEEKNREKTVDNQCQVVGSDDFIECARVLQYILKEVPDMKIFIKYKNKCQNARDYYKVSKPELDKVVGDLISKNNFDKFFEFCSSLGVIRSDRGKYVFSDQTSRYYMFRKPAFDYVREDTL